MTQAVILVGHGSRDPLWREPMDAVAARIRALKPQVLVRCAFVELQAPTFPEAVDELVAAGATEISVLPMFLGAGRHARDDVARLIGEAGAAHPALQIRLLPPAGQDPRLLDLLASIAIE